MSEYSMGDSSDEELRRLRRMFAARPSTVSADDCDLAARALRELVAARAEVASLGRLNAYLFERNAELSPRVGSAPEVGGTIVPVPPASPPPAMTPPPSPPLGSTAAGLPSTPLRGASKRPTHPSSPAVGMRGIRHADLGKPLIVRLLEVSKHSDHGEKTKVNAPVVDYIALDPRTGVFTELRGVVVTQTEISRDLIGAYQRGYLAVTAVAKLPRGGGTMDDAFLVPITEANSGYGQAQALSYLRQAAIEQFNWWVDASDPDVKPGGDL